MIGALPQTPEFIAFVFPKMGRKNRRQKSAAHFGVKSVQPLRSHSCVAVSCRTEKANYIINNCLEDYSIYTVCATLPVATLLSGFRSAPSGLKMLLRKNPCKKSVNLTVCQSSCTKLCPRLMGFVIIT